jgi:hypothetical protein
MCDLVVASAAGMAATRGMTGPSGAGRAVRRAAAIAAPAAAVARSAVVAAVSARRTRLHDGLPHVELRTRTSTAIVIACTGFAGVAGTRRGPIPIAATAVVPQSVSRARGATRGVAALRGWSERLPLAAVQVAARRRRLLRAARGRGSRCHRGASPVLILASLSARVPCRRTIHVPTG